MLFMYKFTFITALITCVALHSQVHPMGASCMGTSLNHNTIPYLTFAIWSNPRKPSILATYFKLQSQLVSQSEC